MDIATIVWQLRRRGRGSKGSRRTQLSLRSIEAYRENAQLEIFQRQQGKG